MWNHKTNYIYIYIYCTYIQLIKYICIYIYPMKGVHASKDIFGIYTSGLFQIFFYIFPIRGGPKTKHTHTHIYIYICKLFSGLGSRAFLGYKIEPPGGHEPNQRKQFKVCTLAGSVYTINMNIYPLC